MSDSNQKVDYGRCSRCGYLMLPVLHLSPCGHDAPIETRPLEEAGRVYSWTQFRLGEGDQILVMADLFGGELRVTAPLVGADSVSIGDEVRLVAGGEIPYVFVPAN